MPDRSKPVAEAVAEAARVSERRAARGGGARRGRPSGVFGGEIRRRDGFPLLVLHLISRGPDYGNRLIEEIEEITQGVISIRRLVAELEPFLDSVIRSVTLIKREIYGDV